MPNQQLISYIQQQLNAGNDIDSIKNYLIKYGYDPNDIEESIKQVYAPKKKSPKVILLIIGILIIVIGIIVAFMLISEPVKKEVSLSINTELMSKRIIPGGYIMFKTEIDKAYPGLVSLSHTLIGPDGVKIDEFEETTSKSKASQLRIPLDAKPGTYTIKTSAGIKDIIRTSTITFSIAEVSEPEEPGEVPSEEPSKEISEEPGELPSEEPSKEPDEFALLTIWERVDAIKGIASQSPLKAKSYCDEIGVAGHKNQCYYNIAEITGQIDYCNLITDQKIIDRCYTKIAEVQNNSRICVSVSTESRRDNCYMAFVQNGDYSVCDKLVNKYYKESCEALNIMANIPDYSQYQVPVVEYD